MWMLQGGLGTPEYFVLPMIPPGSPLPSTNEARPADTQLLPVRCNRQRSNPTTRSEKLKATGSWSILGVWAEWGRGKRTPAITSPLSFDLAGVRFQRRIRLARGRRTRRAHQRITRQPQRDD